MSTWRDFWQPFLKLFLWAIIIGAVVAAWIKYPNAYEKIESAVMKVLGDVHQAKEKIK